jgi:hypothetical protein
VHPPPSPAWANFTLMMECTPESSRCYSVYSVVRPTGFSLPFNTDRRNGTYMNNMEFFAVRNLLQSVCICIIGTIFVQEHFHIL